MLSEALAFLIRNIAGFFILNLLLRFYLQLARASFSHPLAQFVVKLTNFAVLPLRRIVPSMGGYDTATLLLAGLTALLMQALLLLISPLPVAWGAPVAMLALLMLAVLELVRLSLYLLFAALLVQAILSWVNPYNPLTPILNSLTRPFLLPVQKIIPPLGGIDLSPMVLLLALDMLQRFGVAYVESALIGQLVAFG